MFAVALAASLPVTTPARAADGYQIYVSNERSGDVTVIDGASFKAVATCPWRIAILPRSATELQTCERRQLRTLFAACAIGSSWWLT